MGTQSSETRFRNSLNYSFRENRDAIWFLKLQVNVHAHTRNVADFLIHTRDLHAVEIKEIKKSDRFAFKRLSQDEELSIFHNPIQRRKGWVLLNFWKGRMTKSPSFLIPYPDFVKLRNSVNKKSANIKDIRALLPHTELQNNGKYWELYGWFV